MRTCAQRDGGPLPTRGPKATVAVTGEVDHDDGPALLEAILASAAGSSGVTVDFSDAGFVGVVAVNVLVAARNLLRAAGLDLWVRSPTMQLALMIDLFALTDLLEDGADPRD